MYMGSVATILLLGMFLHVFVLQLLREYVQCTVCCASMCDTESDLNSSSSSSSSYFW